MWWLDDGITLGLELGSADEKLLGLNEGWWLSWDEWIILGKELGVDDGVLVGIELGLNDGIVLWTNDGLKLGCKSQLG